MKKNIYSFSVKAISLFLSGVLLFECNAPAFASAVASSEASAVASKLDEAYAKEVNSSNEYEKDIWRTVAKQKKLVSGFSEKLNNLRVTGKRKYGNSYASYVGMQGINTIGELSYELEQFIANFFAPRLAMDFKSFEKQYNAYVDQEANDFAKKNNIITQLPEIKAHIKTAYPAKTVYNEYKKNVKKEVNWLNKNKATVEEAAYQVLREYVKAFDVNMPIASARYLLNLKLNGKDVVTQAEKNAIYNSVTSRLSKADLKVIDIGIFATKKDQKKKVAEYRVKELVELIMLGASTAPSNNEPYANAVYNIINKSYETAVFPHMLNVGFSSLLAIKRYDKLDDILDRYTRLEDNGLSFGEKFSFKYPVDLINTTGGKYLRGKPSEYAQYTTEYISGNAFSDLATVLAEDNSTESLRLLKKYGAEKGLGGILPFFSEALITGKAGATVNDIAVNSATSKAEVESYLSKHNFNPNEYFALKLANLSLADITADQEWLIDSNLVGKYPAIRPQLNNDAIVNKKALAAKQKSRKIYGYFSRAAISGDVAFMIWATFDLLRLAGKAASLAKATYVSVNILKISNPATRLAAMTKNMPQIKKFVAARASIRAFSGRMKNAAASVALGQRALYTSEALPRIAGAGAENTVVAKTLATASYDAGKGVVSVNAAEAYAATAGQTNRVLDIMNTKKALGTASATAGERFANRAFFNKYRNYSSFLSESLSESFNAGKFSRYSREAGLNFSYEVSGLRLAKPDFTAAASGVTNFNWLARPLSTAATTEGTVGLFARVGEGVREAEPLPVDVSLSGTRFWPWSKKNISGIKVSDIDNVLITPAGGTNYKLSFGSAGALTDPSFFKISLDNGSFADFARLTLGGTQEIKLKFMAEAPSKWTKWSTGFKNFFVNKDKMFSGTGAVYVKDAAGRSVQTPIKLITYRHFDGLKVLVNENGSLSVLGRTKAGMPYSLKKPFSFDIPKYQMGTFMNYAKGGTFNNPLGIKIAASKDKVNTLYLLQVLSLSAASTGLIGPLRQNYPEMSNTQESLITVALPYAPSFLSPFWAPFVKRFGSANMMKVSLGLSAASLGISTAFGFNGLNDANIYNPNKPSLAPLLVSASFIGLASSLTRAAFNPLMKEMGGGGGLLTGMMYKNAGSFLMILPPIGFQLWDNLAPRYYTEDGTATGKLLTFTGENVIADGELKLAKGSLIFDEKKSDIVYTPTGEIDYTKSTFAPMLHKHTDFSISNPVLLGLTGLILYKFHGARFSKNIGATPGYMLSQSVKPITAFGTSKFMTGFNDYFYRPTLGVLKETVTSGKVMFRKDVLPLTAAGFGALGVEASMFNKYSQSEANFYLRDENSPVYTPWETFRPLFATVALAAPQFAVRYYSKPLIKALGGENPATYRKIIGLSLGSATAGIGLLAVEDNPYTFLAGAALVGAGFANTTNGILMTGEYNLMRSGASKSVLTDWKVAYPAVHIGMSVVPIAHNFFADKEVAKDPENISKTKALQDNIWIPATVLGGTALLYGKGAGIFKQGQIGKYFAPFKHGAAATFPYFRTQDWLDNGKTGFNYQFTPVNPYVKPLPLSQPVSAEQSLQEVNAEEAVK